MWEAIAAAVATGLITTGSAAAVAAARKSSETRDAVLVLQAKLDALDSRVVMALADVREHDTRLTAIEQKHVNLESRVTALEAGVIDRRRQDR